MSTLAEKRRRLADLDSQIEDLHLKRDDLEAEIENEVESLIRNNRRDDEERAA